MFARLQLGQGPFLRQEEPLVNFLHLFFPMLAIAQLTVDIWLKRHLCSLKEEPKQQGFLCVYSRSLILQDVFFVTYVKPWLLAGNISVERVRIFEVLQ